ncbi:MAG TPA: hypothetical protein VJT71_16685 [Pyrinomonadaceae bacterium]|nr:hypothetical protein [Pyrinomonadaceae bacterium]
MNSNQASHTGVGADLQQPAFLFDRRPHKAWETRMDFDSLGEIIATRTLHLIDEQGHKRPVSVFIGKPEPEESGYRCSYQVIGIGSQETRTARGADSIEALQSAMTLAGASLHNLNQEVGGKLKWNGDAAGNLGFPNPG